MPDKKSIITVLYYINYQDWEFCLNLHGIPGGMLIVAMSAEAIFMICRNL